MPINVAFFSKVHCSYIRSWCLASSTVFLRCFFKKFARWVETVFQLYIETEWRHATYHMLISLLTIVPIDPFQVQIHFLSQEQTADCPTHLTITIFKISLVRRNRSNNYERIHSLKKNTSQNSRETWNILVCPLRFRLTKISTLQTISQQGASSHVPGPYWGTAPQHSAIHAPATLTS